MRSRVAVLGSTGEIGRMVLGVLLQLKDLFTVAALGARSNVRLLNEQIAIFQPRLVSLVEADFARLIQAPSDTHIVTGQSSLQEVARSELVDIVVIATAGPSGILPTISAMETRKVAVSSNKESLVMAGELIAKTALLTRSQLRPVDIEHNTIWQSLLGERFPLRDTLPCCIVPLAKDNAFFDVTSQVSRVILMASGGPFRDVPSSMLNSVKAKEVLNEPSWSAVSKIAVDSASMVNKAFEVVGAHWLFGIPYEYINVLIHPQSIVHSIVEFIDGNHRAALSIMDMRSPIRHALTFPIRMPADPSPRSSYVDQSLTFMPVDPTRYPAYQIALDAGRAGDTYPAVLCGADEAAVGLYLRDRIRFTDIPVLLEEVLSEHSAVTSPNTEEILEAYEWAVYTTNMIASKSEIHGQRRTLDL